jgi:hypothetical protein
MTQGQVKQTCSCLADFATQGVPASDPEGHLSGRREGEQLPGGPVVLLDETWRV